jgi:hypothetical protein
MAGRLQFGSKEGLSLFKLEPLTPKETVISFKNRKTISMRKDIYS